MTLRLPKKNITVEIKSQSEFNLEFELQALRLQSRNKEWIRLEENSRKVLGVHPDSVESMTLLAYSFQQQNRLAEAAELAIKASTLSPHGWHSNFIAGFALKGLARPQEACKYLRQAIAILPRDKQTLRHLLEAIAAAEGLDAAASEYTSRHLHTGDPAHIFVAPVRTMRDWAATAGLTLLEAGDVDEVPFKAPQVWGRPQETETTIVLSNKPYVADLADARIFSNSSIILTSDGTAISDTGAHPEFGHAVNFVYEPVVLVQQPGEVILNFSEFQTREIEAGIFLSGLVSHAFGHWLPEFLPKLQFLQQHVDFAHLPLIVDADMPQSHFDHLRRLCDNPLILLQANESLICRRLLVAPSPTFLPTELFPNDIPVTEMPGLSPRAMRFIRGHLSSDHQVLRDKRIFLARKNMKWRRLLNEEEIGSALSAQGFETVFLEEMTAQEQVDMFQKASWIVAPNGSALLNVIFADPSVKLLVLAQPNLHNWGTFQGPMESLGYAPLYVSGDYAHAEMQKHSDYNVPIERIAEALSFMGINGTAH